MYLQRQLPPLFFCNTSHMYCTMRVVAIMLDDVMPLYLSSPVDSGGLAFGTQEIGVTLIVNGVSLITFQLFVFYRLERRWGLIRCYTYGAAVRHFKPRLACVFTDA